MARILIINPNATVAMTEAICASAVAACPGHEIIAQTSHDGPPAIQGAEDGVAAEGPLLALIDAAEGVDAIIIACFDDTGLAAAKARAAVPVIGIGEAAYHAARLWGDRFSVVTTLGVSVPVIEGNIKAGGFGDICGQVRASEVAVLALEADPDAAEVAILREAEAALASDGVTAIVLGCAGMTGLQARLAHLPGRIIDPVVAASHLAVAMAGIGGQG